MDSMHLSISVDIVLHFLNDLISLFSHSLTTIVYYYSTYSLLNRDCFYSGDRRGCVDLSEIKQEGKKVPNQPLLLFSPSLLSSFTLSLFTTIPPI